MIRRKKKRKAEKKIEVPAPQKTGRSDRDKLDAAKSKLEKLKKKLESVLDQLEPLEIKKDSLEGDIRYYDGRVEKLTIRVFGVKGEKNG